MAETLSIFASPFFTYVLLPFLLVFVIVYSVLEKAKILGEDKKFPNVIVAFVIGFIFIGVPAVVGVTLKVIPIIALILVLILCFLLLFGFAGINVDAGQKTKGIKITLGIILSLAFIGTILWATGLLEKFKGISPETIQYIVLFAIIGGAIALTVSSSKGNNKT